MTFKTLQNLSLAVLASQSAFATPFNLAVSAGYNKIFHGFDYSTHYIESSISSEIKDTHIAFTAFNENSGTILSSTTIGYDTSLGPIDFEIGFDYQSFINDTEYNNKSMKYITLNLDYKFKEYDFNTYLAYTNDFLGTDESAFWTELTATYQKGDYSLFLQRGNDSYASNSTEDDLTVITLGLNYKIIDSIDLTLSRTKQKTDDDDSTEKFFNHVSVTLKS